MKNSKKQKWIREALKLTLKKQNMRYTDLAQALNVSLPTVARFMSKESLTLDRLGMICDCLNLDLYELMDFARSLEKKSPDHPTFEQEQFLVRHQKHCKVMIEVMNRLSTKEISQRLSLKISVVENLLAELQQKGLVTRSQNGEFKVAQEVLVGPRPGGPLQLDLTRRFKRVVPRLIEEELNQKLITFQFQHDPNQTPRSTTAKQQTIAAGGFVLTIEAQTELQRTLHDVWIKFAEIERLQAQIISSSLLKPITFITLVCPGSLYSRAYDEQRA